MIGYIWLKNDLTPIATPSNASGERGVQELRSSLILSSDLELPARFWWAHLSDSKYWIWSSWYRRNAHLSWVVSMNLLIDLLVGTGKYRYLTTSSVRLRSKASLQGHSAVCFLHLLWNLPHVRTEGKLGGIALPPNFWANCARWLKKMYRTLAWFMSCPGCLRQRQMIWIAVKFPPRKYLPGVSGMFIIVMPNP